MSAIDREELKARLERGDDFKLVMALPEPAFRAKHIPGSIRFDSTAEALRSLDKDEEIVVYCSGGECMSSRFLVQLLQSRGYQRVRHYAGGLPDWEDAGYTLEGEMVTQ